MPRSPWIEARRAVSSPQTNAPAAEAICRSKLCPDCNRFCPRYPRSRQMVKASAIRCIARGYSARIYKKPLSACNASAAISIPSITRKGNDSRIIRSIKAPGSPSSPLQTIYLTGSAASATMRHFLPVGNPPPPRPRKPLSSTVSMICCEERFFRHSSSAANPPRAQYSSISSGSSCPECSVTICFCGAI